MKIVTSAGTTVSLEVRDGEKVVILEVPDAPVNLRSLEAGRIVFEGQGFQPAPFFPGALRPEVLRAIADLIERG